MNVLDFLLWGFIATFALTTIMAGCQWAGLSRMSLPFMLGTIVSPDRDRALLLGSLLHSVNGWAFALLYVLSFESLGFTSWWVGALFGLGHGLGTLLVLMPLMPAMHPRMARETEGPEPTRGLEPPGLLGMNYGRPTAAITLAAHVAFGLILGAFYPVAATGG